MFSNNRKLSVQGRNLRSIPVTSSTRGRPAARATGGSQEVANLYGGTFGSAGSGMTNVNLAVSGPLATQTLLNGIAPDQEDYLRKYYRDIYYYDPVAGATIDLLSTFPFSEYQLTGCDQERLDKYNESMERLNTRALMPNISTSYLVEGSSVSSLIFNKKDKVFIDLIMYPVDDCRVEQQVFYSADPEITVRNSGAMQRFMANQSLQALALKAMLPPGLQQTLSSPAMKLDPLTTLYLARRPIPGCEPISFLKRILPIYLLEKTLYRGTLIESQKRQRSMLHLMMGDDTHTYTPEEMSETVAQFMLADLDPLGAVIGTRHTVQAQEIRQGGDFWKWTDTIDTLVPYKLRALGISEAFLSGDASYSNAETALSVFMENTDAYRSYLTYEVFTNKIFPIVAISNNFFKKGKEVSTQKRSQMTYQANNNRDLDIPQLRWHKKLEAKSDENVMDVLEKLQEKGFPIPMRMWAAAAKIDLPSYYQDLGHDKEIRHAIAGLTGLKEDDIGAANDGQGVSHDGGDEGEFARLQSRSKNSIKRRSLFEREFASELAEIRAKSKTGKDKYVHNQRKANAEANAMIVKAVRALQDPNIKRTALRRVTDTLGHVPNIINGPIKGL